MDVTLDVDNKLSIWSIWMKWMLVLVFLDVFNNLLYVFGYFRLLGLNVWLIIKGCKWCWRYVSFVTSVFMVLQRDCSFYSTCIELFFGLEICFKWCPYIISALVVQDFCILFDSFNAYHFIMVMVGTKICEDFVQEEHDNKCSGHQYRSYTPWRSKVILRSNSSTRRRHRQSGHQKLRVQGIRKKVRRDDPFNLFNGVGKRRDSVPAPKLSHSHWRHKQPVFKYGQAENKHDTTSKLGSSHKPTQSLSLVQELIHCCKPCDTDESAIKQSTVTHVRNVIHTNTDTFGVYMQQITMGDNNINSLWWVHLALHVDIIRCLFWCNILSSETPILVLWKCGCCAPIKCSLICDSCFTDWSCLHLFE